MAGTISRKRRCRASAVGALTVWPAAGWTRLLMGDSEDGRSPGAGTVVWQRPPPHRARATGGEGEPGRHRPRREWRRVSAQAGVRRSANRPATCRKAAVVGRRGRFLAELVHWASDNDTNRGSL